MRAILSREVGSSKVSPKLRVFSLQKGRDALPDLNLEHCRKFLMLFQFPAGELGYPPELTIRRYLFYYPRSACALGARPEGDNPAGV